MDLNHSHSTLHTDSTIYTEPATETDSTTDIDPPIDTDSTIDTDDLGDYFYMRHGRAFPTFEEIPMTLPTDDGEIRRLQIQYALLERRMCGILNPLMAKCLTPLPGGQRRSILDIRTQSGIWADQTALRFPHVDVKTIDIAPTVSHVPRPNLHHEVYDIHLGLLEPDNSFDLVHARHSVNMMKDWRKMLKEIHRVLRPGGTLIFCEIEPRMTALGQRESDSLARTSRSARFFDKFRTILSNNGILVDAGREIDGWLRPDDPLWASQPGSGFQDTKHWEWEIATDRMWHPDPSVRELGKMMATSLSMFYHGSRPLFLSAGVTEQEFNSWISDCFRELYDPSHTAVMRIHLVCACKR